MRMHKVCGSTSHTDGTPMDPTEWAPDKLHPTREWDSEIFDKYLREVRAALYNAVGAFEDDNLNYGEYVNPVESHMAQVDGDWL